MSNETYTESDIVNAANRADDAIRGNWQIEPDDFDEDYLGRERRRL